MVTPTKALDNADLKKSGSGSEEEHHNVSFVAAIGARAATSRTRRHMTDDRRRVVAARQRHSVGLMPAQFRVYLPSLADPGLAGRVGDGPSGAISWARRFDPPEVISRSLWVWL
jgi:hypothetical protein